MYGKFCLLNLLFISSVSAEDFYLEFSGTIIGAPCPINIGDNPPSSYSYSDCVPYKTEITPIYKIAPKSDNQDAYHVGDVLVVTYY